MLIKVSDLKEGMVLARSVLSADEQDILSRGSELNEIRIKRLKSLGIDEIYIEDGLDHKDVLDEAVRKNVLTLIKKAFLDSGATLGDDKIKEVMDIVEDVLSELLKNEHLMLNLKDVKLFDEYTYFHSVNVMIVSLIIGIGLKFEKDELHDLGVAALLHDIGKTMIPRTILNHPGVLNKPALDIIKNHSRFGFDMVASSSLLSERVKLGILDHHERLDGSGYPNGKTGGEISKFGKIISVSDVYDALTSKRVYKDAVLTSEAIEYIYSYSGTYFDPEVVKVFMTHVMPFPIGSFVKLSDQSIGQVTENHKELPYRPKVKIVMKNNIPVTPYYIDLLKDHDFLNITITNVVESA